MGNFGSAVAPTGSERALAGEIITALVVRGLIVRDGCGHLVLTGDGRAALRALCCWGYEDRP